MRDLFEAVRPRSVAAEEQSVMRHRYLRLRRRLRLRLLGVGRAGWIAVGVLAALWTVAILA